MVINKDPRAPIVELAGFGVVGGFIRCCQDNKPQHPAAGHHTRMQHQPHQQGRNHKDASDDHDRPVLEAAHGTQPARRGPRSGRPSLTTIAGSWAPHRR
jgi:hypothetical protein